MTKNIAVVLPAEATGKTAEKVETIARATGSALTGGGRRLGAAITAYAASAAAAHMAPFDILAAAARKSRKNFD